MEISYALRQHVGLQYILDEMTPCTPYGAERVRRLRLYGPDEREALEAEWANVHAARDGLDAMPERYDRLRQLMGQVRDIRGTLRRCHEAALTEVELFEVKRFLLQLALIVPLAEEIGEGFTGMAMTREEAALALLDPDGGRGAGFAVGMRDAALIALREEKRQVELTLRGTPEGAARDELLARRRDIAAREEARDAQVRAELTNALRPRAAALLANADALGRLDFTIERAVLARRYQMAMPHVSDALRLAGMHNPMLARDRAFTPIDIECPLGVTVITGANMGGKSVAMRTLALNALLCQAGFFACAAEAALPLFAAVHFLGEDTAEAAAGLSSFGAEVVRIQAVIEDAQAGTRCLIAMDEPARGTNPDEGAALVRALVGRLAALPSVTVIATHYSGTAEKAQAHYQAAGLRDIADAPPEGDRLAYIAAHMDYGLVRVGSAEQAPREALTVCRLLGLDEQVVRDMAEELAKKAP